MSVYVIWLKLQVHSCHLIYILYAGAKDQSRNREEEGGT